MSKGPVLVTVGPDRRRFACLVCRGNLFYDDWSAIEQSWKDRAIFPVIPESALRATLGILARTVAPGKARPEL
jgi:hypothetical protein